MSSTDLVVRQVLNSLDQVSITSSQDDAALGNDSLVNDVAVEVLFLTFLKLLFFLLFDLTVFVVLDRAVEEAVLGIFESARVAIKDVTTVAAGILGQLLSQELVDNVFRDADR